MVHSSTPRAPSETSPKGAVLRYSLSEFSDDWVIREDPVPVSAWHDRCLELLKALLDAWIASSGGNAAVFRDIAIQARREKPRLGWNPNV